MWWFGSKSFGSLGSFGRMSLRGALERVMVGADAGKILRLITTAEIIGDNVIHLIGRHDAAGASA